MLDEPSIGLHQRDNQQLLNTLKEMRDLGNTVLVVEHDLETILAADHVVDMGPGAGEHGGCVVAQGTPEEIATNASAPSPAHFLSGRDAIPVPRTRRKAKRGQLSRWWAPRRTTSRRWTRTSPSASSPASPASRARARAPW